MSDPGNTLPDRLARQLAGDCLYGKCGEKAKDGADYCGPHHEKRKADGRKYQQRRRKLLKKAKRCVSCGKPAKRSRCASCRRDAKEQARARRSVENRSRSVGTEPERTRGHMKLDASDRREGRNAVERYVGRDRRGAPSKEDRYADILRDAGYAKDEIGKFVTAFRRVISPEVQAMSRSQRDAATIIARDHAAYAARFLDDIVDRLK